MVKKVLRISPVSFGECSMDKEKNAEAIAALREKIQKLRGEKGALEAKEDSKASLNDKKYSIEDLYKFIDDWCENKYQQ